METVREGEAAQAIDVAMAEELTINVKRDF